MSGLLLKNIYKVYPSGVTAVQDFCLDIKDKEFIVFVGPSGCGKSTTLRMIAGLEEISAGELYIDGELMNNVAPKDRDIAMVFQNYALYPHMSVYDNMAFGLKLRKMPKAEIDKRVKAAAEILGISAYLSRKPKALSGGQKQRVALGRAIVREPKVFLLDEPLSNLDAKLRATMRTEITKLHNRLGTTFIYVTHDQVEAMTMGTRIVVMKDGFMQQVDTPQNLYDFPANKFVAGFIGTPQMNFFKAKLTGNVNERVYAEFGLEKLPLPKAKIALMYSLEDYLNTGKEIILGIRPEDLRDDEEFMKTHPSLRADVDLVEMLGSETLLYGYLRTPETATAPAPIGSNEGKPTDIVARVNSRTKIKRGMRVRLGVDVIRCHMFDAETEVSLVAVNAAQKAKLEAAWRQKKAEEKAKREDELRHMSKKDMKKLSKEELVEAKQLQKEYKQEQKAAKKK